MIKNYQFDTIYHEHISFFSVKSFCTLANRVGLKIIDVSRTSIHGTSFLFVLSNEGKDNANLFIEKEVNLDLEKINAIQKIVRILHQALLMKLKIEKRGL